jgi:hypothetical protein
MNYEFNIEAVKLTPALDGDDVTGGTNYQKQTDNTDLLSNVSWGGSAADDRLIIIGLDICNRFINPDSETINFPIYCNLYMENTSTGAVSYLLHKVKIPSNTTIQFINGQKLIIPGNTHTLKGQFFVLNEEFGKFFTSGSLKSNYRAGGPLEEEFNIGSFSISYLHIKA